VRIDHPRHHRHPGGIDHVRAVVPDTGTDMHDLVVHDQDIRVRQCAQNRVLGDDASVSDENARGRHDASFAGVVVPLTRNIRLPLQLRLTSNSANNNINDRSIDHHR
jgi:hypothetical protein